MKRMKKITKFLDAWVPSMFHPKAEVALNILIDETLSKKRLEMDGLIMAAYLNGFEKGKREKGKRENAFDLNRVKSVKAWAAERAKS